MPMKTVLTFFFVLAATLAGAILTAGQIPDAPLILAGTFAAILTAWTLRQYDRKFIPFAQTRLSRPSVDDARPKASAPPRRLAA